MSKRVVHAGWEHATQPSPEAQAGFDLGYRISVMLAPEAC